MMPPLTQPMPPSVLQEASEASPQPQPERPRKARRVRDPSPSPYVFTCWMCMTVNTGSVILVPRGSEKCYMLSWWRHCGR